MLLSVLLVTLLSIIVSSKSLTPSCYLEPANLQSMKEEFILKPLTILSAHETVNNLPTLSQSSMLIGPDDIPANFVQILRVPDSNTVKCPASLNATAVELSLRTTCPFMWVLNYDRNRWPESTAEVACMCDKCLEFSPDGTQTSNGCEPVFYYIRALRRVGCDGRFYRYIPVREKIQISCTCAHPHVGVSTGSTGSIPTN